MALTTKDFIVVGFKGLDESLAYSPSTSGTTRKLDNVDVRFGVVTGRGGTRKFDDIATVAPATITGIWQFPSITGADAELVRMTASTFYKWAGTTFADVTGDALTGDAVDLPQAVLHDDVFIFTNEGQDRPRKYVVGLNSLVLGGTPPFCKTLVSYQGLLLLFNVSDDGTTWLQREGRYSDDYDADWTLCDGNSLFFNEFTSPIIASAVLGRSVYVYSSDGIVRLTKTPTNTRFQQERLAFDKGILAPLSLQVCGEQGMIFLGTDYELYICDGNKVVPLPAKVQKKLQSDMLKSSARTCRSAVQHETETYTLFYPASSGNRRRIDFNWRTGEFVQKTYAGHSFFALTNFKLNQTVEETLVACTTTLVYETDINSTTDDGTTITRYIDTDWQSFDMLDEKVCIGATLLFERTSKTRASAEIAWDNRSTFSYKKGFDLRGAADGDDIIVHYDINPGIQATWFNIRVKFYHDLSTARGKLKAVIFHYQPVGKKQTGVFDTRGASLAA